MDETIFANIYADMRHASTSRAEEDEIAGPQAAALDVRGCALLVGCGARHIEAEIVIDEINEAAAIESVEIGAAIAIRHSDQRNGAHRDLIADAILGRHFHRRGRCSRNAGRDFDVRFRHDQRHPLVPGRRTTAGDEQHAKGRKSQVGPRDTHAAILLSPHERASVAVRGQLQMQIHLSSLPYARNVRVTARARDNTLQMIERLALSVCAFLMLTAADSAAAGEARPNAIRAHVSFLADDLLEGRAAGSRGHELAAAYVAAQFLQLGLTPGGDDGSYSQTVHLLEATAVLPGSAAELNRDRETVAFEYGRDYLPTADFLASTSTVTAPLAFVGFGVSAPELDYDDLAQLDIRGRIAVAFSRAPAKFPADQRAYYSWAGEKYANLIRRGAVGLITIDLPEQAARMPWDRRVAMSWVPQMRWLDADGQPTDAYPELKLRFSFNADAAAKLFAGAERSLESAFTAASASEPQAFYLPGLLTLSATTGLRRTESSNVLGILRGSDPRLKHEYIVVTAHLDHLGRGAAVNGDTIYNGAQDNAVGIAILLETARILSQMDARPGRSIVFAAVTAEEKGLLGSDFFVQHPTVPRKGIIADLNIDMPLPLAPVKDLVAFGAEHSSLGPLAQRAAEASRYRLSPDPEPDAVHFIRSDQFSFIRQGIPALAFITGNRSRDGRTDIAALKRAFLDNRYHQPSDDLSQPIDYIGAADLADIYARMLVEIANAPTRPKWNRGDFFEQKFGR